MRSKQPAPANCPQALLELNGEWRKKLNQYENKPLLLSMSNASFNSTWDFLR